MNITRYMQKYGGELLEGDMGMYIIFNNPAMTDEKMEKFRKLLVKRYAYNDYDKTVTCWKVCRNIVTHGHYQLIYLFTTHRIIRYRIGSCFPSTPGEQRVFSHPGWGQLTHSKVEAVIGVFYYPLCIISSL